LSDVVRRLRRKGLIQRRRNRSDARAICATLTDEGRRLLETVMPLAAGVDRNVLEALPGDRRKPFIGALASIVAVLEPPR
jgi:DNA-binding MarR family transcriptional regulator